MMNILDVCCALIEDVYKRHGLYGKQLRNAGPVQ